MGSLVRDFQRDIVQSGKGTTELLRTAKLISAKLDLPEITEWLTFELGGYPDDERIPAYRCVQGGELLVLNPRQGWILAGNLADRFIMRQRVSELEALCLGKFVALPVPVDANYPVQSELGIDISGWHQRVRFSSVRIKGMLSAIRDQLLDWSTELEKRGIIGENMSFDEIERQTAHNQVFNIHNVTGVVGNILHSNVQIYDYSTLHQTLKSQHVPQSERNELENIMDELKASAADPAKKTGLIEKAKRWIVKNEEFLGASASIVRKAFGLGD